MGYFVHDRALCESEKVGEGSRVGAFSHVFKGATIGRDCSIDEYVLVENDVRVGNRVTVQSGVQLWAGIELEDDVYIGPNVTFTNDRFPRSRQAPKEIARTVVGRGASVGANATLLPGISIGQSAMVGAGSVVTRNVPPNAIVHGNPARIHGYVSPQRKQTRPSSPAPDATPAGISTAVAGVTFHRFKVAQDLRGSLSVGHLGSEVPFIPERYFIVYDVPSHDVRGEHAHRQCSQFLICVRGSVRLLCDDGTNRDEFLLDTPSVGVHIPPMIWGTQYRYSSDATLLVFASRPYEPEDYIRDYDEYLAVVRALR